jgi:hypothetical protein
MTSRLGGFLALCALTFGLGLGTSVPASADNECLTACRQDYQECIHNCTFPYQCQQCSVIYSACAAAC